MSPRSFAVLLPLAAALTGGGETARAEIYTWVDATGVVTYSDAAPPKGARLLNVVRDTPAKAATAADLAASREAAHQAELRALNERIRLLEQQVDLASRTAPPVQYVNTAPPPAPCDPTWSDCGYGWSTPFLSTPVVIIRQPHFHHRFGHERNFVNNGRFQVHNHGMRTPR